MKERIKSSMPATATAAGDKETAESMAQGIMAACTGQPGSQSARDMAEFITQDVLLTRLPISRRTAFEWRKTGKLPAIQIGDKLLFHWPTVRDALLRQQIGGGGQ